jgi:hypothetical protein
MNLTIANTFRIIFKAKKIPSRRSTHRVELPLSLKRHDARVLEDVLDVARPARALSISQGGRYPALQ